MSNGWSDVTIRFTRLEAVTVLQILLTRHTELCHRPDPEMQVHCGILKALIDRIWVPALES